MGVGQLFAGPLADKLGRRTVALGGITIYAMSALLAWSAQNIEWPDLSKTRQREQELPPELAGALAEIGVL